MVEAGKDIESVYWELVVKDIHDTCKLLEPIYIESEGVDGYVSVAVSPKLANDTKGTIEAAKWLQKMLACPNVYVKIPAIDESVASIKEVISLGISVNVTVSFLFMDVLIYEALTQIRTMIRQHNQKCRCYNYGHSYAYCLCILNSSYSLSLDMKQLLMLTWMVLRLLA